MSSGAFLELCLCGDLQARGPCALGVCWGGAAWCCERGCLGDNGAMVLGRGWWWWGRVWLAVGAHRPERGELGRHFSSRCLDDVEFAAFVLEKSQWGVGGVGGVW